MKAQIIRLLYIKLAKPVLFLFSPDLVHDYMTFFGNIAGNSSFLRFFTKLLFYYENPKLEKNFFGLKFKNPIGLSAGFDADGKLAKIMPSVGFGFATIGTVTNRAYGGNVKPLYTRLIKSKSILVNKGFKSEGVESLLKRINDPFFKDIMFGVSVGSSNVPVIDTVEKAIQDYVECFKKLKTNSYIKYYELNISCPNTCLTENFLNPNNFERLLKEVLALELNKPLFIKMPNEGDEVVMDKLVEIAFSHGIKNFIFSNLAKDRKSKYIHPDDLKKMKGLAGNLSGLPTFENSNYWIKRYRRMYRRDIVIIGCGGVFNVKDAKSKLEAGADLIQMITGLIFEGPEIVGLINKGLAQK
ncbi:hypothetical protein HYV31_02325 [candidate division WWE3 bacterium]|nr:hypothetical protein [candidate division WWE3 bacterium]